MATTSSVARRTRWRPVLALVAGAATAGVLLEARPSLEAVLDPTATVWCPLVWPPDASCVPGAHLVVVGASLAVLALTWLGAEVVLRRGGSSAQATAAAVLAVVALTAWSAARVPGPWFLAVWGGP